MAGGNWGMPKLELRSQMHFVDLYILKNSLRAVCNGFQLNFEFCVVHWPVLLLRGAWISVSIIIVAFQATE